MAAQALIQDKQDLTKFVDWDIEGVPTGTRRTVTCSRSGTLFEASSIVIDGTAITNLAATDVKAALAELQGDITALSSIQGEYLGSRATVALLNAIPNQGNGDWAILSVDDGANQRGIYVTNGTTFTMAAEIPDLVAMGAATATVAGTAGIVPAPAAGSQTRFLRGDATWAAIPAGAALIGATGAVAGTAGIAPAPAAGAQNNFLRGDATWAAIPAAAALVGATATVAGTAGMAPAPAAGAQNNFLRGDATWVAIPAVAALVGATATVAGTAGIAPAPAAGAQNNFLRGDGTWAAGALIAGTAPDWTAQAAATHAVLRTVPVDPTVQELQRLFNTLVADLITRNILS